MSWKHIDISNQGHRLQLYLQRADGSLNTWHIAFANMSVTYRLEDTLSRREVVNQTPVGWHEEDSSGRTTEITVTLSA